jgi:hypothetical protein
VDELKYAEQDVLTFIQHECKLDMTTNLTTPRRFILTTLRRYCLTTPLLHS